MKKKSSRTDVDFVTEPNRSRTSVKMSSDDFKVDIVPSEKKTKRTAKKGIGARDVSRHKAYYEFSDEFPDAVDDDGMRHRRKRSTFDKKYIVIFVSVFLVTAIISSIFLSASYKSAPKPVTTPEKSYIGRENGYKAVRYGEEIFDIAFAEKEARRLITSGVNTIIIPMKTADGKIYFDPSINVDSDSLVQAKSSPSEIVDEFKSVGYYVVGEISCFADDIYARNHIDQAAYIVDDTVKNNPISNEVNENQDENGENNDENNVANKTLWYDSSSEPHAWLTPFSNDVSYYLNMCISDVYSLGFDGILLDNVSLPYSQNDDGAVFPLNDGDRDTVNEKMASFVMSFATYYTDRLTFAEEKCENELRFSNQGKVSPLGQTGVSNIFIKINPSSMGNNVQVGDNLYIDPMKVEDDFVCDIFTLVSDTMSTSKLSSGIAFEVPYAREKTEKLAEKLGEKSYIFKQGD